jgi:pyridoxal phosphate enzyme (YggS family)
VTAVDTPAVVASQVAERAAAIQSRIDRAGGGRPVRMVAVTKGFGPDAVEAAVAAGITLIGENYAADLVAKATAGAGGDRVRWHFIGGVQRNKVAALAPFVAVWQTVDRPAAAASIARHSPGAVAYIEVNLTGDPRRAGCAWNDLADVIAAARDAGLQVRGLMGVGPTGPAEPRFAAFTALADAARLHALPDVSMGMSGDFEEAVAAGSTMVRLGTALFGPRPGPSDLQR